MGADAPQWLVGAFVDALSELGVSADRADCEAEAHQLIGLWNAPGRTAHNFRHLIHVLTLLDELAAGAHDADILRVAVWYHGACITRDSSDSSDSVDPAQTSAICDEMTRSHLTALGTPVPVIDRVVELLGYIGDHSAPADDTDAQVLVDADLGRLALSPQEFAKYREGLRDEYSSMDDACYYKARRRSVKSLLARDTIFFTEQGSAWEDAARSNLELELARIEEKIRSLCPESLEDEATPAEHVEEPPAAAPFIARDEDLISDNSVAPQTRVIKRRSVKLSPSAPAEELVTTGVLPAVNLVEDADPAQATPPQDTDSNLSSLESAVDTLGIV